MPPTVDEAAAKLEIKSATVRSWVLHRKIKFRKIGRSVRIPNEEIERILNEGTVPAKRRLS